MTVRDTGLLRAGLRVLATAIVAAALGGGIGLALGKLKNPGDDAPAAAQQASARAPTTSAQSTPQLKLSSLTGRIVAAKTAFGKQRKRLSIRVHVTASNTGPRPVTISLATLAAGGMTVRNDPHASVAPGALLGGVSSGAKVSGELRFETAGSTSDAFSNSDEAQLSIGNATGKVRFVDR